ncbi:hypothetical protein D3C77_514260 [compost metagenome]
MAAGLANTERYAQQRREQHAGGDRLLAVNRHFAAEHHIQPPGQRSGERVHHAARVQALAVRTPGQQGKAGERQGDPQQVNAAPGRQQGSPQRADDLDGHCDADRDVEECPIDQQIHQPHHHAIAQQVKHVRLLPDAPGPQHGQQDHG